MLTLPGQVMSPLLFLNGKKWLILAYFSIQNENSSIYIYFFEFIYFGKKVYVADFLLTKRKVHKKFYLRILTGGCSLEDHLSDSSEKQL